MPDVLEKETTVMDIASGLSAIEAAEAETLRGLAEFDQPDDAPAPAPTRTETPSVEVVVAQAVAPLVDQIAQLQAQLAQRPAATVDPQTFAAISSLASDVEKIKLETMPATDQVAYLLNQRELEQAARVESVRRQAEAAQAIAAAPKTPDPLAAQWDAYDRVVAPALLEMAATHGISEADAKADIAKTKIQPIVDAKGNVSALDMKGYMETLKTTWQGRSAKREDDREASRAGGDGGRPGGRIAAGLDPWDVKYNAKAGDMGGSQGISRLLQDAAAAGIFDQQPAGRR